MQWLPKKNANLLNSNEMGKVAIRMNAFLLCLLRLVGCRN